LRQRVELVFLQGDEWRNDERGAGNQSARDLVNRRLAGSCRHHSQRIPACQHRFNQLLLAGPELVETQPFLGRAPDLGARNL
jgi:hypothetical protein